jgi:hypothetical protein
LRRLLASFLFFAASDISCHCPKHAKDVI